MTQPSHREEVGIVPTWMIALLGFTWLLLTLATIAYVGSLGPLG